MKTTPKDIARATVDLCRSQGEKDYSAIMDGALHLLVEHGMQSALRTFPDLVRDAWFEASTTVPVTVTASVESAADEKKELVSALEKALRSTVELTERQDPSLIGGLTLRLRDDRLDFSLRGALSRVQTELTAASAS